MATLTASRQRPAESFRIHEDAPSTEDTQMNENELREQEEGDERDKEKGDPEAVDNPESEYSESSDDETEESSIQRDMEKLQDTFPGFKQKYRLIKRIGEGWNPPSLSLVTLAQLTRSITQAPFPPSTRQSTWITGTMTTRGTRRRTIHLCHLVRLENTRPCSVLWTVCGLTK
jgi:hypothetical protein